jgi:polyphosphate kinase 2 (PPK2 family)
MTGKSKITISSEDFRVNPGSEFKLSDRPTDVKPICKSKKQYKKLLDEHVEELSDLQHLHYAPNRYALLIIFQGMDAAGSRLLHRRGFVVRRARSTAWRCKSSTRPDGGKG